MLLLFVSRSLQTPLKARFHIRGCLHKPVETSCCDVQLMDVNELGLSLVTGRTLLQLVKFFWSWIVFIPFWYLLVRSFLTPMRVYCMSIVGKRRNSSDLSAR